MPTTTTGVATEFISFTRASNATVVDSNGLIDWAAHNLLRNSESFDATGVNGWAKTNTTIAANSAVAPNGTTTADKLNETVNAFGKYVDQDITAVNGATYTFGFFAKQVERRYASARFADNSAEIYTAYFDLDGAGAVVSGTGATITSVGNGWFLCTIPYTTSFSGALYARIYPSSSGTSTSYTGVAGSGILIWGAHLYRSDMGMQANTSAYPMYNPTTPKNLLGYTEDFGNAAWAVATGTATKTSNTDIAPNGLQTADTLAATSANTIVWQTYVPIVDCKYTGSIYLKRKSGSGTVQITVDGSAFTTVALTTSWERFSLTYTAPGGSKAVGVKIVTSGDEVLVWGAQLSDSASLDPYVPVYGAAVTSAAYYGPRRDFDGSTLACKGLLVEEQRTNLLLYSAQFNNSYWADFDVVVSGAAIASPAGSTTTNKIVPNSTSSAHAIRSSSIGSGGSRVISVYVYPDGFTKFAIQENYGQASFAAFDCTGAGSLLASAGDGSGATIVKLASGWYRVTMPATQSVNYTAAFFVLPDSYTSGSIAGSWSGDGVKGIYLWGAQTENGSFATSYIPTTTASATRSADVAQVSTAAFPYSATEGAFVVSGDSFSATRDGKFLSITDGTASGENNCFTLDVIPSSKTRFLAVASGLTQANFTSTASYTSNSIVKIAGAYKQNDFGGTTNGEAITTDTTGNVPAVSVMEIGFHRSGSPLQWINGHIRQITYIPRRLSNAELQTRTS